LVEFRLICRHWSTSYYNNVYLCTDSISYHFRQRFLIYRLKRFRISTLIDSSKFFINFTFIFVVFPFWGSIFLFNSKFLLFIYLFVMQSAKPRHESENFLFFWHHWFQNRFLHILPKIWTRSPQNSLSQDVLKWNHLKFRFSGKLILKLSFFENLISRLVNYVQSVVQKRILRRSVSNFRQKMQHGTANEKKVFPTYARVLAKASCTIMFYNTWK